MRYTLSINAVRCQEWGLNLAQGALMDLINQSNSWAQEEFVDGKVYYWVSRNKIIDEIPVAYSKADTVYRSLKVLSDKDLISHIKKGKKDLVRLTEKGKTWNVKGTSQGDSKLGNKSELDENPEINPSESGNKSENTPENTEISPTDKSTSNKTTNDKKRGPSKKDKPAFDALSYPVPSFVKKDNWCDFVEMRKRIKKPLTETACKRLVNKIIKLDEDGFDVNDSLDYSITGDYQTVFERKRKTNNFQGNTHAAHQPANSQYQPKQSAAELYSEQLARDIAEHEARQQYDYQ